MKFCELTIHTDSEKTELLSFFVGEITGEGVTVYDGTDLPTNAEYIDEQTKRQIQSTCLVRGYCTPEKTTETVERIKRWYFDVYGEQIEVTTEEKDDSGYLYEYKKWEKPIIIGKITVAPTLTEDEICIVIDSVLAFGNGQHYTTALCIEALQQIDCAGKKVLDVGCGSGVLGFCALKLGASALLACDYDADAVDATMHNAEVNGLSNLQICQKDMLNGINERYDVVIANITAQILLPHAQDFTSVVAGDGYLLLSGMLDFQTQQVIDAYGKYFTLSKRYDRGEWSALLFTSKTKANKGHNEQNN